MKLVQITKSYLILLSLATLSKSHVLVAGNEDAFRSLARNYVPKILAEKLVDLVSQANKDPDAPNVEEEEEAEEEYTYLRADDQGQANQGQAEPDQGNQGQVNQGQVNQGKVNQGQAEPDQGNQGQVNQGQVNQGKVNQGQVSQGQVHQGQGQVHQGQVDQAQPEQVDQTQRQQLQEEQALIEENIEYENPENHEQEYQAEDRQQYEDGDGQVSLRVQQEETNPSLPRQMQVNLDELVEKVRERLLDELKTSPEPGNIAVNLGQQRPVPKLRPLEQQYEQKKITYGQPTSEPKHLYKTKGKAGVVIETGDLYDKVKLTKAKKKDSYEDYAKKLPKKDYDVFETEEESKPKENKQEERPSKKLKLRQQEKKSNSKSKSTNLPYRNENNEETNDNVNKGSLGNNNNSNSVNKVIPKRTRPTPQNYDRNKTPYDSSDMNGPKIDPQTTSNHPTATTPVEYVDDDLTVGSTVENLMKAATEYIGGIDYYKDDAQGPVKKTTTEEPAQYPKKKKQVQKKIVTNMQIRLRYTLATPDFYGKLPRVAEKYNFEEPIPEKDREQEVPKQIGPPPAIINGNVKV